MIFENIALDLCLNEIDAANKKTHKVIHYKISQPLQNGGN